MKMNAFATMDKDEDGAVEFPEFQAFVENHIYRKELLLAKQDKDRRNLGRGETFSQKKQSWAARMLELTESEMEHNEDPDDRMQQQPKYSQVPDFLRKHEELLEQKREEGVFWANDDENDEDHAAPARLSEVKLR